MAPFPPWMGSMPYRSSSDSPWSTSSTQRSTITIIETTSSHSLHRRGSSPFGYFKDGPDVKVKTTYHFDFGYAPKPKLEAKPTTPVSELTKFLQEEWTYIKRGRWGQSGIMALSVVPALFGSMFLLMYFGDRKEERRREKQRAAKKEAEDWGEGFQ